MSIDCLLEEFDFSPHKLFGEEYEFSVLYEETQREYSSIVTATNKNVNKKNILQKGGLSMETPGPLSICLTNMVIVFGVLIFLACVIQLIHIVDPTKGKKK